MTQPFSAQIVSPPFACGLPWLASIFRELGVEVTQDESQAAQKVLCGTRLEWAQYPNRRTVVLVRDPRDAILASYRAQYRVGDDFGKYLATPREWFSGKPDLLRLAPADAYAYISLFWREMSTKMDVLVVRYEELGLHPAMHIARVMEFLGYQPDPARIERAVASATIPSPDAVIAGESWTSPIDDIGGTWRQVYEQRHLDLLDGSANYGTHILGYEVVSSYDYAAVVTRVETAWSELSDVVRGVLLKVGRLERYGDSAMIRKSLVRSVGLFPQNSLERAWLAQFVLAFNWIEFIFPLAGEYHAQRRLAFELFCRLNRSFLVTPTLYDAMAAIFAELDVQIPIDAIRADSGRSSTEASAA